MNDSEYLDTMKKYILEDLNNVWKDTYEEAEEIDNSSWVKPKKEPSFSYETMLTNVMEYLESVGGVEFAILKDPELGRWWAKKVKVRDEKRKREAALNKLKSTMSKEELKILGINVK